MILEMGFQWAVLLGSSSTSSEGSGMLPNDKNLWGASLSSRKELLFLEVVPTIFRQLCALGWIVLHD